MGLGMFVLGGALSGAGAGMLKQQEIADTERRDRILEELKNSRMQEEYRLIDQNSAAKTRRDADVAIEGREDDQAFKASMATASAQAQAADRQSQREFDLDKLRIQGSQAIQEIITRANASAQADADKVDHVIVDKSGAVFGVTRSGKTRNFTRESGVISREEPSTPYGGSAWSLPGPVGPGAAVPDYVFKRDRNGKLILDE